MKKTEVTLVPLKKEDKEQFIKDNQWAFKYGATKEYGMRDDHFEEDGEIISRDTILESIKHGDAYHIVHNNKNVGGVIIRIEKDHGELEILFVNPEVHSKGIGYAAWCEIEKIHPEVKVWETVTPYFETRNIHFYVNRCGFHIVEYFNSHHPDPNDNELSENKNDESMDGMFRFQKIIE